jgi:hypothetical protein
VARPIEATPTLTGADADRLRASLSNVAPANEIARRQEAARAFLAQTSAPKVNFGARGQNKP